VRVSVQVLWPSLLGVAVKLSNSCYYLVMQVTQL